MTASILIPVYNVERYLARCLDSVLAQTEKDFEVICVNDGSTDSSLAILRDYEKKDSRICVIDQENRGVSFSRNAALARARGEYVFFLDSDDAIHPQLLACAISLARREQADVVNFHFATMPSAALPAEAACDYASVDSVTPSEPLFFVKRRHPWRLLPNIWSKIYRREFLNGHLFACGTNFEDAPYILSLLAKKPKVVLTRAPLYFYSVENTASLVRARDKKFSRKDVEDFSRGLSIIADAFQHATKKEWRFLQKEIFANYLKQVFNMIARQPRENQAALRAAFADLLCEAKAKRYFSFSTTKFSRYWTYCRMIRARTKNRM